MTEIDWVCKPMSWLIMELQADRTQRLSGLVLPGCLLKLGYCWSFSILLTNKLGWTDLCSSGMVVEKNDSCSLPAAIPNQGNLHVLRGMPGSPRVDRFMAVGVHVLKGCLFIVLLQGIPPCVEKEGNRDLSVSLAVSDGHASTGQSGVFSSVFAEKFQKSNAQLISVE